MLSLSISGPTVFEQNCDIPFHFPDESVSRSETGRGGIQDCAPLGQNRLGCVSASDAAYAPGAPGGHRVRFELGFRYAHKCALSASSVEDAVEKACAGVDPVQTQASGILGSPVGTQSQVTKTFFRTKCSLLFMVPPRAVHAWVLEADAHERSPATA